MAEVIAGAIRRGRTRLLPAGPCSPTRRQTIVIAVVTIIPTFTLLSFTPSSSTIAVTAGGLFSIFHY